MCKICEYNQNIISLEDLIDMKELNCSRCANLKMIPRELVKLEELNCSICPLLTEIPRELVNLIRLDCSDCPLVTEIPRELTKLEDICCVNCPWLNHKENKEYKDNMNKLEKCQSIIRRNILSKKICKLAKQLIPTWWDPECHGGYFHKKRMLNDFPKKKVTWSESVKYNVRCSNNVHLYDTVKPVGRHKCKCGYPELFCTIGCLKRSSSLKSEDHFLHHSKFMKKSDNDILGLPQPRLLRSYNTSCRYCWARVGTHDPQRKLVTCLSCYYDMYAWYIMQWYRRSKTSRFVRSKIREIIPTIFNTDNIILHLIAGYTI